MEVSELLERWAQVESERCETGGFVRVGEDWYGFGSPGVVLAAVIEAIEARGFGWAVVRGNGVEGVTAMVEGGSVHRTRIAPTPAAALLSAYLAAMEAD